VVLVDWCVIFCLWCAVRGDMQKWMYVLV
jgi:hypothetical protein